MLTNNQICQKLGWKVVWTAVNAQSIWVRPDGKTCKTPHFNTIIPWELYVFPFLVEEGFTIKMVVNGAGTLSQIYKIPEAVKLEKAEAIDISRPKSLNRAFEKIKIWGPHDK